MLYNKEILNTIDERLKKKCPNFNIHVLLHLLQSATRPLGYPPVDQPLDSKYYLNLMNKKIHASQKNGQQFYCAMNSLYQIMVCFCYLQYTLGTKNIDTSLLNSLYDAINERADTTDEERGAEKSFLSMLIRCPAEILPLIGTHFKQLGTMNLLAIIDEKMNYCGRKQLNTVVNSLTATQPTINIVAPTTMVLSVIKSANQGIHTLRPITAKNECQMIIGLYLLKEIPYLTTNSWINESPFLKASYQSALQERARNETKNYISIRSSEFQLFSLFAKHSKTTKLSAANKFLQLLTNRKDVSFSPAEHEALCDDKDSRLTRLYLRYKSITPI